MTYSPNINLMKKNLRSDSFSIIMPEPLSIKLLLLLFLFTWKTVIGLIIIIMMIMTQMEAPRHFLLSSISNTHVSFRTLNVSSTCSLRFLLYDNAYLVEINARICCSEFLHVFSSNSILLLIIIKK